MNIEKSKLPPTYKRNGKKCYLDPIRKRLIYVTPEETVRQKVISYLLKELEVPAEMIKVEEPLSHYGLKSKDRADVVILAINNDNMQFPLAVIECKATDVPLDENAINQALYYSESLGSEYTLIINGEKHFCYKYDESQNKDFLIETLPKYTEMLTGDCKLLPEEELPERVPFEELEPWLHKLFKEDKDSLYTDISKYTPMDLALPVFNLWEGLLDTRVKMPTGTYGLFELLEDYGVRMLTYGNASGGQFFGPYRSFLVKVKGNTEFFSIGLSTYWKASWAGEKGKDKHPLTSICVAHDDEKTSHHSLQLVVDEDAKIDGKTVKFYHSGRIAIGRIGSGKKSELRALVNKRYPKILAEGDKYYLGSITADHLLRLDEPDVMDLITNLISYSIVRDEYRNIVKSRK